MLLGAFVALAVQQRARQRGVGLADTGQATLAVGEAAAHGGESFALQVHQRVRAGLGLAQQRKFIRPETGLLHQRRQRHHRPGLRVGARQQVPMGRLVIAGTGLLAVTDR